MPLVLRLHTNYGRVPPSLQGHWVLGLRPWEPRTCINIHEPADSTRGRDLTTLKHAWVLQARRTAQRCAAYVCTSVRRYTLTGSWQLHELVKSLGHGLASTIIYEGLRMAYNCYLPSIAFPPQPLTSK